MVFQFISLGFQVIRGLISNVTEKIIKAFIQFGWLRAETKEDTVFQFDLLDRTLRAVISACPLKIGELEISVSTAIDSKCLDEVYIKAFKPASAG